MSRKTAIRITNAEVAAEEYRRAARGDVAEDAAPMSTIQLLRQARGALTETELLRLAQSAARLELRGDNWDAEDRADCASEVMWHILAEHNGETPLKTSPRASLTHACHVAANWRAAQLRRRAAEERARQSEEDRLAQSGAAMLEVAELADLPADYRAAREAQAIEEAHRAAQDAIERLEMMQGGPVHAVFYAWARGATADQCAADNGVSPEAWEKRLERGRNLIRAAFPEAGELIERLTETLPALHRRGRVEWPTREGTDGGSWPTRPATREDAREVCVTRHQCPVPGLSAINASRVRRGYLVRAPMVQSTSDRAPAGYLWIEGRDARQAEADARRNLARIMAQASRRERGIDYAGTRGGWTPGDNA